MEFLRYAAYHSWTSSRSKDSFRKQFVGGESNFGRGMAVGSEVSRLLEHDPTHELVRDIPRYAIPEFPLVATVRGVPCLSHPDSFDPYTLSFYEYKTAVEDYKWTKAKVLRHEQLVFYATLIRAMFGDVNRECFLIEIRTKRIKENRKDGALQLNIDEYERERDDITGEYLSPIMWPRTISDREMDEMEKSIEKTWNEITEYLKTA